MIKKVIAGRFISNDDCALDGVIDADIGGKIRIPLKG
jgi:hypothetical protein